MKLIGLLLLISVVVRGPGVELRPHPVQDRLFAALSRAEHCMSWNNPGCLKFAHQWGARLGPRGYAIFDRLGSGQRALRLQLSRHAGETVKKFLRSYNPEKHWYEMRVVEFAHVSLEDIL